MRQIILKNLNKSGIKWVKFTEIMGKFVKIMKKQRSWGKYLENRKIETIVEKFAEENAKIINF